MVWTRLAALAGLFGVLFVVAEVQAAGPAVQGKGKGRKEQTFKGVITHIHHNKGKGETITVRGHEEHVRAGKKGGNHGRTMTFHVGPGTLIRHVGNKGKRAANQVALKPGQRNKGGHHLRVGDIVEVAHVGHQAVAVLVEGHVNKGNQGKGRPGLKNKK
jgi:hypothetical protein